MIELRELNLKNVFAIKKAKIVFSGYGLTVIYGTRDGKPTASNGVGKSSVLEALDWLLFDCTNKGVVVNDIVRRGSKNCFASLLFDIGDTRYKIIKRRGKVNTVKLIENGVDISYKDQDTTKARLKKILPISHELWSNIISIGQGKSGLLFEGTDKERKDAFVQLLQLDILDKALLVVRDRKNKANDALTYHSGRLSSLKIMEDDVINDKDIMVKLRRKTITLDNSKGAYNRIDKKWEKIATKVAKNLAQFQHLNRELEKYRNAKVEKICPFCKTKLSNIDIITKEIRLIKKQLIPIANERIDFKKRYSLLDAAKEKLDNNIERLQKEVNELNSKLNVHRAAEKHNVKVEKERDDCIENIKKYKRKSILNKRLEDIFGPNGYRKYLITNILDRITEEMNILLRGINNITVKFFTKGIKFDIVVIKDGVEFHKNSLSGGEKKLLSIAYNLALVNVLVGRSVNCLFYDEILSQLDEDNCIKAIDYLKTMADSMKINIFLVTNQLPIIEYVNRLEDVKSIRVNCVGGISHVEQKG